ncbi:hypothetical protein K501DRAFT_272299 [Backusella circina FSU 941]|nr:hypothetical protein K501DRAFT_272299 [Backusella circina FSU 941]
MFYNDLEKIKNNDKTPSEIKRVINSIKPTLKKKKQKVDKSTTVNQYTQCAASNSGNSSVTIHAPSNAPMESTSDNDTSLPQQQPEAIILQRDKRSIDNESTTKEDNRLSSLYSLVYDIYKHKAVDVYHLKPTSDGSLEGYLYNAAIKLIKKFKDLSAIERSYLHVLLSSSINIVTSEAQSFLNICMPVDAYQQGGKVGLRIFVCKTRESIYESNSDYQNCFELKILDIMEHVLNMAEHNDWSDTTVITEQNYGENASSATKLDRVINETEFGICNKNIMGRRLDLREIFHLINDSNCKQMADLRSIEIKRTSSDQKTKLVQLNKNIRINKSMLSSLYRFGGPHLDQSIGTLGLEIVGLTGIMYGLKLYDGIVISNRVADSYIHLPFDELDIEDFLKEDSLDQLLHFMDHNIKLASTVNLASRRLKRQRKVEPNLPEPSFFPENTFYTPKRVSIMFAFEEYRMGIERGVQVEHPDMEMKYLSFR